MKSASPASSDTRISVSPGLADRLEELGASLALTSYRTGQLILIGRKPDGVLHFTHQTFGRAMGVTWRENRLLLASRTQLWRFENLLEPGEMGNGVHDAILVPRIAFTVGDLDLHEVALGSGGMPLFVSTLFNCIGSPDPRFSFRPLWKPPFVASIDKGDRCHLNGMATRDGVPVLVTALSMSGKIDGWRQNRAAGGVLMSLPDGEVILDGLAMPHSPRWSYDGIYLLESGRGMLVYIDGQTGTKRDICFLPGFARGLSIIDGTAVVTLSRPREISFAGLPLADELARRGAEPCCGLAFIDLNTGELIEQVNFEGRIGELFDVTWLPGLRCPAVLGIDTEEIRGNIRLRPVSAPSPSSAVRALADGWQVQTRQL